MTGRSSIKLKSYRKRAGLTQRDLPYMMGMKEDTAIARFEKRKRVPTMEKAFAYQAALGEDLEDMFPEVAAKARKEVGARAALLTLKRREQGTKGCASEVLKQLVEQGAQVGENATDV